MKILCVHQGAELYGSDRSFIQCVSVIAEKYGRSNVEVLIPKEGTIATELRKHVDTVNVANLWIARKSPIPTFLKNIFGLPIALIHAFNNFRKYDLVYINTVVVIDYILLSFLFSKKSIIHVREIPTGHIGQGLKSLVVGCGASLIFNSKATKQAFGNHFKSKAQVIHNGVAAPDHVQTSTYDGIRPFRLLLIGRINDWKGQDLAIEAMSELKQRGERPPKLRIVGETFEGKENFLTDLQEQVTKAGLSDDVEFHPFTSDPSAHFNWCDAVLVPSKKPEPFGRVAIEALAYGRPVIAANHGGLTEIVIDGISGLVFEPCNSAAMVFRIRDMSENIATYRSIVNNLTVQFEANFTEAAMKCRIVDFFNFRAL